MRPPHLPRVELANIEAAKGGSYCHLRHGIAVSQTVRILCSDMLTDSRRTCLCGSMRTYYAIYVYYFTYDVPWYAYYGWVWTALEAQLGVVCASAPALKIFCEQSRGDGKPFLRHLLIVPPCLVNRYFNFNATRSGLSKSSGKKASGYGKASAGNSFGNSLKRSHQGSKMDSYWTDEPVPLNQIQISKDTHVVVEDRDDAASETSTSSTRNLTALPIQHPSSNGSPKQKSTALPIQHPSPNGSRSAWLGSRTICTAFRPGSTRSNSQDIERDAAKI
jgi:hypothetical protein